MCHVDHTIRLSTVPRLAPPVFTFCLYPSTTDFVVHGTSIEDTTMMRAVLVLLTVGLTAQATFGRVREFYFRCVGVWKPAYRRCLSNAWLDVHPLFSVVPRSSRAIHHPTTKWLFAESSNRSTITWYRYRCTKTPYSNKKKTGVLTVLG